MNKNKKVQSAAATLLLAGGITIGAVVPGLMSVTDYSRVFNAPGDFTEIIADGVAIPNSWEKTHLHPVYGVEMIVMYFPVGALQIWPGPTHVVKIQSQADTTIFDFWWGRDPTLLPTNSDTLDWWVSDLTLPLGENVVQHGDWKIGIDACFTVTPELGP